MDRSGGLGHGPALYTWIVRDVAVNRLDTIEIDGLCDAPGEIQVTVDRLASFPHCLSIHRASDVGVATIDGSACWRLCVRVERSIRIDRFREGRG